MGRHFFLILAVLAVLLMAAAGAWKLTLGTPKPEKAAPGARATPVSVTTDKTHDFVDRIEVLGVVKGRQSVTITSSAAELVTAVRFKDGDKVAKGQVLVELKAGQEDAAVAQAKAAASLAEANDKRWSALAAQGVAPKATSDQYHAAYLQARAAVIVAQAQKLDRVIRAPFAGMVGLSDVAPGMLISAGTPIVSLDDLTEVRVDFDVPDRYLPVLAEGAVINARTDAYPDTAIVGRIAKIDSRIDVNTRAIKVRALIPNTDGRLKPGMLVKVALENGRRQAVAAPESAIQVEADQPAVFMLMTKAGKTIAVQKLVVTGAQDGGLVEIREGLKAGDKIVADGVNRVQSGRPVRVVGKPDKKAPSDARGPAQPGTPPSPVKAAP